MRNILLRLFTVIILTVFCGSMAGCMSAKKSSEEPSYDESDQGISHQYLVIPNAYFVSGLPTQAPSSSQKPLVNLSSGSSTLTTNEIVTWTVDFSIITEIEVTEIIISTEDLDGYFIYELEEDEIDAGTVDIDMYVEDQTPTSQTCQRDFRGNGVCYEQADSGITGVDFAAADNSGGMTAYLEMSAIIESIDDDYDEDDSDTESGYSSGNCSPQTGACGCTIQACCNADVNQCWYNVNGIIFNCSGTDCGNAAQSAAQYCVNMCL